MSELIDRQALKAAHGLGTDCGNCKQSARSCQYDRDFSRMDFCEWLDDAPTIEAAPVRHGEWKVWADKHGMTQLVRIVCSECGKDMMLSKENIPNYCPNCGARMDGERRELNYTIRQIDRKE